MPRMFFSIASALALTPVFAESVLPARTSESLLVNKK